MRRPRPHPDHVKLIHGPYRPPALKKGDRATCLYRDGTVVITSRTAACGRRTGRAGPGRGCAGAADTLLWVGASDAGPRPIPPPPTPFTTGTPAARATPTRRSGAASCGPTPAGGSPPLRSPTGGGCAT